MTSMAPPVLKAGPVTRVCHVCGRQYGLSSFDIHLKQCKKLFLAQEEQKPPNERRQLPKTPPGLDGLGGGGGGGRGLPSSDSGGTGNDARPSREVIEAMNRAAQESFNERMEKCENCGRSFAEGRLAIHAKSCRPGNAAKRVDEGVAPRNKKDVDVDYPANSPQKKVRAEREDAAPIRPTSTAINSSASSAGARPLAGSLASNRRKIASQESTTTPNSRSTGSLQSPLGPAQLDVEALRRELQGNESMVSTIQAKLDHWEATTLATLQEIRDLKQLFAQIQ